MGQDPVAGKARMAGAAGATGPGSAPPVEAAPRHTPAQRRIKRPRPFSGRTPANCTAERTVHSSASPSQFFPHGLSHPRIYGTRLASSAAGGTICVAAPDRDHGM